MSSDRCVYCHGENGEHACNCWNPSKAPTDIVERLRIQSHLEGYRAALEEAARVAEGFHEADNHGHGKVYPSIFWRDNAIAAAIRALKDTP